MTDEECDVLEVFLGMDTLGITERKEFQTEEGGYNMCTALREIREEGIAEGKTAGMAESILDLLAELGEVPAALKQHIYEQEDFALLKRWHKIAAKALSIADFEAKLNQN